MIFTSHIAYCMIVIIIYTVTSKLYGFVWSLTSFCHSNGHIETMPAREINPFIAMTRIRSQFLRTYLSTSNSSASGHDYTSDRSAIGAGANCMVKFIDTYSHAVVCDNDIYHHIGTGSHMIMIYTIRNVTVWQ